MPPAIIAAVIGAAATATGIGVELANQPSTPSAAKQLKAETPGAVSQLTQQRQLEAGQVSQSLPGLQENTLGGVSPQYLEQMGATLTGNGDLLGTSSLSGAVNNFLGIPGLSPGSSSGTVGSGSGSGGAGGNPMLAAMFPGLLANTGGSSGLGSPIPGISGATDNFLGMSGSGSGANPNPFATSTFGV